MISVNNDYLATHRVLEASTNAAMLPVILPVILAPRK